MYRREFLKSIGGVSAIGLIGSSVVVDAATQKKPDQKYEIIISRGRRFMLDTDTGYLYKENQTIDNKWHLYWTG